MNGEIARPMLPPTNPSTDFDDSADAINAAVDAELAELAKRCDSNGGGRSTVKGPWSPEQDEVLTRLVNKLGPRNWTLISRGIPGRSGKSCRLRWCNQLDPCLKRKPFTGNVHCSRIIFVDSLLMMLDSCFVWGVSISPEFRDLWRAMWVSSSPYLCLLLA